MGKSTISMVILHGTIAIFHGKMVICHSYVKWLNYQSLIGEYNPPIHWLLGAKEVATGWNWQLGDVKRLLIPT